jgi:hypothetical protein
MSSLMDGIPKVGKPFRSQLREDVRASYEDNRAGIWNLKLTEPAFSTKCGQLASMLPMLMLSERYTITAF